MAALIVDIVLALTVLEAAFLVLRHVLTGSGLPPHQVLPNLAAGLFLTLAVRLALEPVGWGVLAVCLALAGVAHILDLRAR